MQPTRRALLLSPAALAFPARAQSWPSRAIRIVIAYPPGGSTDLLGRLLAQRLQETISGSAFVVENRPGGGAITGTDAVARAAADGHTLALGNNQTHASNQSFSTTPLPHQVIESFVAIARLAVVHHAFVVPANHPARTLDGLIALARGGRQLTYASSSVGSASHVIAESFSRRNGLNATHVPYRGGGPATTDTVAGVVDFFVSTWPQVVGLVKDGRLRALSIGAPARLPEAPDVPTAAEAGHPETAVDAWFGMFAPAGTPTPIVDQLGRALTAIVAEPAIGARLTEMGFLAAPQGPEAFAAFQRAEVARWAELARDTGIRMQ
jgi:tripartite-type tricarboxylate transporter receptor subunit TctC